MDASFLPALIVSFIWGVTNPLMKRGASSTLNDNRSRQLQQHSFIRRVITELVMLFCGTDYLLPFALNQCGSVLFYYCLIVPSDQSKLSVMVPTVNALTFVFTAIFAAVFNSENLFTPRKLFGLCLIVTGVYLTTN